MPWPKGKPRSLETKLKMTKSGVLREDRMTCKCGAKKDPYRKQCRACNCANPSPKQIEHSRKLGLYFGRKPKSDTHKQKLSESNRGKHLHFGERNPNWRGGVSTLAHLIRTSRRYRNWQSQVFKRSCGECFRCKQKVNQKSPRGYACHHIVPFKKLCLAAIEASPLISALEACLIFEPLWDQKNGILMHKDCHIAHHADLREALNG